jgi:uncharacterized protein YxeA
MKKIIAMVILITMVIYGATAQWQVFAYDSDFNLVIKKTAQVEYTGQAVTLAALKSASANVFNLTYTGQDSTINEQTYYKIIPKDVLDKTVEWVNFSNTILIQR